MSSRLCQRRTPPIVMDNKAVVVVGQVNVRGVGSAEMCLDCINDSGKALAIKDNPRCHIIMGQVHPAFGPLDVSINAARERATWVPKTMTNSSSALERLLGSLRAQLACQCFCLE